MSSLNPLTFNKSDLKHEVLCPLNVFLVGVIQFIKLAKNELCVSLDNLKLYCSPLLSNHFILKALPFKISTLLILFDSLSSSLK